MLAVMAARAPVTLIVGEEELLVERAVAAAIAGAAGGRAGAGAQAADGEPAASERSAAGPAPGEVTGAGRDVQQVSGAALRPGELAMLVSPSLFGGARAVVVRDVQDASPAVAAELAALAQAPPEGVTLVVTHSGGAKGRAVLAALSAARRIDCPAIRRFGERLDFARAELARAGRKADDRGLRALVDAVGTNLRDLAAACDQLASDTAGVITAEAVGRYWRGRAEASGFTVADRALEGDLAGALVQLRWALSTGTAPVLITSALARGIRVLAQVAEAQGGRAPVPGMAPWLADKARQQLRGWTAGGLARAHMAVAEADAQVKGEGASAGYALERLLRTVAGCRAGTAPAGAGRGRPAGRQAAGKDRWPAG